MTDAVSRRRRIWRDGAARPDIKNGGGSRRGSRNAKYICHSIFLSQHALQVLHLLQQPNRERRGPIVGWSIGTTLVVADHGIVMWRHRGWFNWPGGLTRRSAARTFTWMIFAIGRHFGLLRALSPPLPNSLNPAGFSGHRRERDEPYFYFCSRGNRALLFFFPSEKGCHSLFASLCSYCAIF